MRMIAGIAGSAAFSAVTYVIAFLVFIIGLKILQIDSISQFTFLVAVHVAMIVALIAGRFGWKLSRQDVVLQKFEAAWSSVTETSVPRWSR